MYVHRSNRAEALVAELADLVAQPLADPCASECIVVQGRGMERWLSMQLARRLGVWANPDFPFPRHLLQRALRAFLDVDQATGACFEPEVLMWSIADLLVALRERDEFAAIHAYLADDDTGFRRIQLAERVARILDQYVVYRPRMILAWEEGRDEHWQAVLWRAIVARHGSNHVAAQARRLLDVLAQPGAQPKRFPSRVSVFGVSTLPPLHVQMLSALAKHVEVHLFLLSPSAEYWAGIRSQRDILRAALRHGGGAGAQDLHLEVGNPLLASLGRLGADFQYVLEEETDYQEGGGSTYVDPGTASLLATVQSDILALRHRRPEDSDTPPVDLDPTDDSITVHSCHTPMREVEVLHDRLLELFDRDPTLEARDVVVMSPAIDAYAPLIDAVFAGGGDRTPRIPYRIADRAVRATDDVVNAFLTLLAVLRGRMTASAVLDLLDLEPIRERFGLVAEDLDLLRDWIGDSGIRWGIDVAHRQEAGQPALAEHTWQFGLDRLLLGYAMAGKGRRLFAGVLPYDDVEGSGAELLGRLAELCSALFSFHASLQTSRTLDDWRDVLGRLLGAVVASNDQTAHQHRQVHAALAALAERAGAGRFLEAVGLDTVQQQLLATLEQSAPGRGFLSGGVTFCALVPMRSIPFRVVALLGMNDADFPRLRRAAGFDLIAQEPARGDRSAREDDRYLFLEALLSARERILITYVGQSMRDNSEIPPSVVVSELLDVLGESFRVEASRAAPSSLPMPLDSAPDAIRDQLVVRHPLQPFSPRYFGTDRDSRLFSYARNHCEGARASMQPRREFPPFLSAPLPPDETVMREVSVSALTRFFENPTRAFLQDRVSLFFGREADGVEDREPLQLDSLDRWKLGTALLSRAIAGESLDEAIASVRASGALPPGTIGTCTFEAMRPQVVALAAAARDLLRGDALEPLTVDAELEGTHTRVTGVIRDLWSSGQVQCQFSALGGRRELGVWIRHLVLNWLRPEGYPCVTFLVGRPQGEDGPTVLRFRPPDNAAALLDDLVQLYWLGQQTPLLFFERASRAYVEHLRKSKKASAAPDALRVAEDRFNGSDFVRGDVHDEYVRQVFGTANPLARDFRFGAAGSKAKADSDRERRQPSFAEVASAVLGPLLAHREELK